MTARLDWYGCATFRLTVGSLVIFLDSYIDHVPGAAGTGLRADDIERADWIVGDHSHFDHLWGAERIAIIILGGVQESSLNRMPCHFPSILISGGTTNDYNC